MDLTPGFGFPCNVHSPVQTDTGLQLHSLRGAAPQREPSSLTPGKVTGVRISRYLRTSPLPLPPCLYLFPSAPFPLPLPLPLLLTASTWWVVGMQARGRGGGAVRTRGDAAGRGARAAAL